MFLILLMALIGDVPKEKELKFPKSDYVVTLENYNNWNEKIEQPTLYKNFSWKDKKFEDLSDFEKDQLYLLQIHQINREMEILNKFWLKELAKAEKEEVADITEFLTKLRDLRVKTAKKSKIVIENLLKKNENNFTKQEAKFIQSRFDFWCEVNSLN